MSAQVLVVDDEALILQSLRSVLEQEGFDVSAASSGHQAWQIFTATRPDVVLLDLVLADTTGIEVLRRIRQLSPETKVILISAHATFEQAIEAMKLGSFDFIRKPFELEEIVTTVRNAAHVCELEGRVDYLARRARENLDGGGFVYSSEPMAKKLREIDVIARSQVPTVLIQGETGTGKQLVAQLVHDRSSRHAGPFVELNCSTLPESLVESELFGHERGAFSDARERKLGLVEIADGGTLFLDEIGDLSLSAQAKFLTFLEQRTFRRVGATAIRKVDVRVIAATHRPLRAMVENKTFRDDLFFRLNAITVALPPLRERKDEIVLLAKHFLRAERQEHRTAWQGISPAAQELLEQYAWPGNVRELRAVLSRATLLYEDSVLQPEHLPSELHRRSEPPSPSQSSGEFAATPESDERVPTLAQVELAHIRKVLAQFGGNRTLAAQKLGVTRQTLARKLEEGTD